MASMTIVVPSDRHNSEETFRLSPPFIASGFVQFEEGERDNVHSIGASLHGGEGEVIPDPRLLILQEHRIRGFKVKFWAVLFETVPFAEGQAGREATLTVTALDHACKPVSGARNEQSVVLRRPVGGYGAASIEYPVENYLVEGWERDCFMPYGITDTSVESVKAIRDADEAVQTPMYTEPGPSLWYSVFSLLYPEAEENHTLRVKNAGPAAYRSFRVSES
jgi:hypothetical protein